MLNAFLKLFCACLLGLIPTLGSEYAAYFLTEEAAHEGVARAKKDFSCTLRVEVDLRNLKSDLKTVLLPLAVEETLNDTLAKLERLHPDRYAKLDKQIDQKGGKATYLKHILASSRFHGNQRPKVEGGYAEWINFPGSIEEPVVDLSTYSPTLSMGSATLVSMEGSRIKGLDNRVFVSAAHVFRDLLDAFEGKYTSGLLPYATVQVPIDGHFHSYKIRELFVPKKYGHYEDDNYRDDIVIGILEEAITENVKPATIDRNYFEEADRAVLPQVFWQSGFPHKIGNIKKTATYSLSTPAEPWSSFQIGVAGHTLVSAHNPTERTLGANYYEEVLWADWGLETSYLKREPLVYIDHNVFPNEFYATPHDPNKKEALFFVPYKATPFIFWKEWSYLRGKNDIISGTFLNQIYQQLENENNDNNMFRRATYTSESGQLLLTMTYFNRSPESILLSGNGMNGGGVFVLDNDTPELIAVISKSLDLSNLFSIDIPELYRSIFSSILHERKTLVWPFWKEFLEECAKNVEESKFRHINAARTASDRSSQPFQIKIPVGPSSD